ncbi:Type I Iterative PKS [Arachnomyces sp. PD_36]|nr:Type I Iterative PKS [Arachnomyces sp. PD_36]
MEQPKSIPIAIVGMSCRLPGDCTSPQKLWEFCKEKRSAWSEIPKERFNGDAFTHSQREHLGTFDATGAHFLNDDVAGFDAPFFNYTADVAKGMDPQLRWFLEVVFEAFEDAGIPIENVAGSRTAVFAGTCFRDYHDMAMRDLDNLPRYLLLGNMLTMTANRVSHFFDLRGPSVSLDTACSTSLTALHLACQALRAGEANMAVVGGSNMILHAGTMVGLSSAGLLGPDGRSYAFDSRAEGYGRGEGVGAIVIRPLSDALRDGDSIHAVIRETAINQDGKTLTPTSPSKEAQEQLIRECYDRAGLDPLETPYAEAHGTGTIAGDVIESQALGAALASGRPLDQPLFVGSVKSNLGHLEATSGMAALFKAVKMLQNKQIPPQALLKTLNPQIDFETLRIKVPTELQAWPEGQKFRVSINNFGAGGANSHVILDHTSYHSHAETPEVHVSGANKFVFTWSAKDERGARKALQEFATDFDHIMSPEWTLSDLAYTLSTRRSLFPWRVAISASSLTELKAAAADFKGRPIQARTTDAPKLGFIFTGQGAQWFAMGRELGSKYPLFKRSLEEAEEYLSSLDATWSLQEELSRDKDHSRVNSPDLSFPLTVIIQLCLVRLLASWGVMPTAVTGHSSGEISAAYAAGALEFEQAISIAYFRGKLTESFVRNTELRGGMIALGVSKEEAKDYLCNEPSKKVVVACINSPSSVTISGDLSAIEEVEARAAKNKVFARRLKVEAAYHSHHMELLAHEYLTALATHVAGGHSRDTSNVLFSSPVTGGFVNPAEIARDQSHWVRNMTQCVLFEGCFRNMMVGNYAEKDATLIANVDLLVEIGPHGALKGPIQQILSSIPELQSGSNSYISCLTRGQDACLSVQEVAGWLHCHGYPICLSGVNFPENEKAQPARVMQGLNPYPWNHTTRFWNQPMMDRDMMQRKRRRSPLLGAPMEGLSPGHSVWRNVIRVADIPWLRDHLIQSGILFPGAGLMTNVMEAMRQIDFDAGKPADVYKVQNVELFNALIVPQTTEGLDVQVSIHKPVARGLDQNGPREFSVHSRPSQGDWVGHCTGETISMSADEMKDSAASFPNEIHLRPLNIARFYKYLQHVGPTFGPSFQLITGLMAGEGSALATITITDGASEYWSDIPTLDACFHSSYAAIPKEQLLQMGISIPTSLRSLQVSKGTPAMAGDTLTAATTVERIDNQGFVVSVTVFSGQGDARRPVIKAHGLRFRSLGATSAGDVPQMEENICLQPHWQPDISLLSQTALRDYLLSGRSSSATVNRVNGVNGSAHASLSSSTAIETPHENSVSAMSHEPRHPLPKQDGAHTQLLQDVSSFIQLYSHKTPRARVLQIATGNVESYIAVVDSFRHGGNISGLWTQQLDLIHKSVETLDELRSALPNSELQIQYRTLNIEDNSSSQELQHNTYDLVVISNAQDFASPHYVLNNIGQVMKPGGQVMIMNPEHSQSLVDLWVQQLSKASFNEPTINIHQSDGSGKSSCSMIMSKAPGTLNPELGSRAVTLVVGKDAPPIAWLKQLTLSLHDNLDATKIHTAEFGEGMKNIEGNICIFLAEVSQPILADISNTDFTTLKNMLKVAHGVLWISRAGQIEGGVPEGALHLGLLRTLRMEDQTKRYITLDLDPTEDPWTSASVRCIRSVLPATLSAASQDFEFAERKGQVQVPRLIINPESSGSKKQPSEPVARENHQPFRFQGPCLRLEPQIPGQLNSLAFREVDDAAADLPFASKMVEIEPKAIGLNFRDIMVAMDQMENKNMGFECAGVITSVSDEAAQRNLSVGDRVCALLPAGHWSNKVRVPWTGVAHIAPDVNFATAASVPMIFATAYHALVDIARLTSDDVVLIHAAAGGVDQAAILIAQHIGARVLATVGSDEKRQFLTKTFAIPPEDIFSSQDISFARGVMEKTQGNGVDVILNSLAGPLLKASWDCIGAFGRFVELGKQDLELNKYLEMRHFSRSVMYTAVDIVQLGLHKGQQVSRLLKRVVELVQTERMMDRVPITAYGLDDLEQAFRLMSRGKHIGKIVLNLEEGAHVPIIPHSPETRLRMSGSHLIVGGLAGLGREIAKWMATKGAKDLILMSRNVDTAEARQFQGQLLQGTGTRVHLIGCDISSEADLHKALAEYEKSMPPIRGVIQAAAVLKDTVWDNMTHEQWEAALRPKLHGTRNLHRYFQTPSVDYFIILSSVTGVVGSLGQANYTAAGTYQDVLALTRRSRGLAATSIDLGSVLSVGIAARTKGVHERLERAGYAAHEIQTVLDLIASAISSQTTGAQVITGLSKWATTGEIPWRYEPRFSSMVVQSSDESSAGQRSNTTSLKDQLKTLSSSRSDVESLLLPVIQARLAEIFSLAESDIDPKVPPSRYGVDSLVAVELRNWMTANIVATINLFDLTQSVSIIDLVKRVAEKYLDDVEPNISD